MKRNAALFTHLAGLVILLDSSSAHACKTIYEYVDFLNPSNILTGPIGYGIAQCSSGSYYCPPGNFTDNGVYCTHNSSGANITGWSVIEYASCGGGYAPGCFYKVCNQNEGCSGGDCGTAITVRIFYAYSFNVSDPSGTTWILGTTQVLDYGECAESSFGVGFPYAHAYLVARGAEACSRPDPRVHYVEQGEVP